MHGQNIKLLTLVCVISALPQSVSLETAHSNVGREWSPEEVRGCLGEQCPRMDCGDEVELVSSQSRATLRRASSWFGSKRPGYRLLRWKAASRGVPVVVLEVGYTLVCPGLKITVQ